LPTKISRQNGRVDEGLASVQSATRPILTLTWLQVQNLRTSALNGSFLAATQHVESTLSGPCPRQTSTAMVIIAKWS
jgi:hypothetical protein